MKALTYYGRRDIRLEEVPIPEPGEGEVLVKVTDAGLCQTQINEFVEGPNIINTDPHPLTDKKIPMTVGHEYGGVVIRVGKGVDSRLVGQQVAILPKITCGECYYCRSGRENLCEKLAYIGLVGYEGGFAEYSRVPAANVYPVANRELLTFIEPFLVAIHASQKLRVEADEPVLILGAGAIGISVASYLKTMKNQSVVLADILPQRIQRARQIGFEAYLVKELKGTFNAVMDCAGADPFSRESAFLQSYHFMKKGAILVVVGVYFHTLDFLPVQYLVHESQIAFSYLYRDSELPELDSFLKKFDLNYDPILQYISLDGIIKEGYFRAEIDKDSFTRLVIRTDG